jgi:hypothetical protein
MPSINLHPELSEYYENIPSYQELFGSLKYIGTDECNSIFSPAAYFLELMRITDDYIIDSNRHKMPSDNQPTGSISDAYLLSTRRPDLFELELNCYNTNNLVHNIQIVISILERYIQDALKFSGKANTDQLEIVKAAQNISLAGSDSQKITDQNSADPNIQKRDALVLACSNLLNSIGIPIKNDSELYGYFLIDVETTESDTTSYIAQAIGSIQLYIQRCRFKLEPGITNISEVPDSWWIWMGSYRIWDANRNIFIYPENNIDPSLSKNTTQSYKKFQNVLSQTIINDETVTAAYLDYFREVAELSLPGNNWVYLCEQKLISGGIDNLLTIASQETVAPLFKNNTLKSGNVAPFTGKMDFKGPFDIYFWETFFHIPFLIAKLLSTNKYYDEARRWYQFIYNPSQSIEQSKKSGLPNEKPDPDTMNFWQFLPFRSMTIESLTELLTSPAEIEAYHNEPFDPDAISRIRTSAFAKSIVMNYIDNLIECGDFLFAEDTSESIKEAVNFYMKALDLLGEHPQQVGEFKRVVTKSFNDLRNEYSKRKVTSGKIGKAGLGTAELVTGVSDKIEISNGMFIEITKGKGVGPDAYLITKYENKVITVSQPWATMPNETSEYLIYTSGIPYYLIQSKNSAPAFQIIDKVVPDLSYIAFNNIDSYFSIPQNQSLISYWQTIEDRLSKIKQGIKINDNLET